MWRTLLRPSARFSMGLLLLVGIAAGVVFWGGFNWAMDLSNTETFCISCHEMRRGPYEELKKTVHWSNPSGVRATCADCHVPKAWHHKLVRKIQATNELFHKIAGTVNTPAKFEARRLEMAANVWAGMKSSDSRECRNCHRMDSMELIRQLNAARKKHERAAEDGDTCIDCHQGIAHELPDDWEDAYDAL